MNKEDNTSEDLMQDLWDEDSPLSDPPTDPDLAGTPQTMDDDWIDEGVNAITPSEIIEIVLDTGDSGIIDLGEFNAPDTKTEDFEIFADVDDFDEDIFVKTGITFINIETGDLIQTEDFPDRPSVGLKIHDDPNIPLPGPWAQFMTELRDETLAEPDPRKRGAYLYVFSRLATFFGQSAQRVVRPLAELAQVSGAALRSDLLLQLAFSWDRADDTFLTLLNRLERIDSSDEGALSSVRRSSIAMERLLCGGVSDEFRVQLRDVIIPPETFPGLLVLSADAHAAKDPVAASRSWIRLTNYTKGQLQSAVHSVVAYFLQSSPRFHPELEDLLSRPNARALLLIAQREAKRRGDRAREIDAVRKLISQDVAAGKKMASAAAEKDRLKAETGARLHQLSNLLRNSDAEAERQSPYDVLRDAIRLNPTNRVVLREMIRNAIDR